MSPVISPSFVIVTHYPERRRFAVSLGWLFVCFASFELLVSFVRRPSVRPLWAATSRGVVEVEAQDEFVMSVCFNECPLIVQLVKGYHWLSDARRRTSHDDQRNLVGWLDFECQRITLFRFLFFFRFFRGHHDERRIRIIFTPEIDQPYRILHSTWLTSAMSRACRSAATLST